MLAIKEKKTVRDGKVTVDVPKNFGSEVEIIILTERELEPPAFWDDEELKNFGHIATSRMMDNEDYSRW